jgi:hypothetical protein
MGHSTGRVSEIRIAPGGYLEIFITCPESCIPSAGQYLLAVEKDDSLAVLATPIFLSEPSEMGFWGAAPFNKAWQPGARLDLLGPFGHGFDLPKAIQRLGLVALGDTVAHLLPLVGLTANSNTAITLFTNLPLVKLPAAVEVYPLSSLREALDWPDFMALDLPLEGMNSLREVFGHSRSGKIPCPAQALVIAPMPCVGLARCGACAIRAHRGWKLVCEDGPVFDLNKLDW